MTSLVEEAAFELYALEPSRFTAERSRRAGQARSSGAPDAARAISGLRRPTTAAWLINQLVRGAQDAQAQIERLDALGHELRLAQAHLQADRMRELNQERHGLVEAIGRRADAVAATIGVKVSPAVRREVEDTLRAAVADEHACRAVLSGRLTRALVHTGFGEVDIAEATAVPLGAPASRQALPSTTGSSTRSDHPTAPDPSASGSQERIQAARRADAQARAERAREQMSAEQAELRHREDELGRLTQRRSSLQQRLDDLQAEITTLRRELDTEDREISRAERDLDRRRRRVKHCVQEWDQAEAALADLAMDPDPHLPLGTA